MNYVRKLTALILAVVFCVALVIGVGVIFSVRNVNVEYIDYSGNYTQEYKTTEDNLQKLKGSGLLFIGKDDIKDKLSDDSVIAVASYEKIYPCTVNVVVKERVERFALKLDDGYAVYDADGILMREERDSVSSSISAPVNALDESDDVVVNADSGDMENIAAIFSYIEESFGGVRTLVSSATVNKGVGSATDSLQVKCRSGISFIVGDWKNNGKEKIIKIDEIYSSLSEKKKLGGSITVVCDDDGVASGVYSE